MSEISNGQELATAYQKLNMNDMHCPREPWAAPIRVGSTGWEDSQNAPNRAMKKGLPRAVSGARGGRGDRFDRVGSIFDNLAAGTCDKCKIFRKPANPNMSWVSNARELATTYQKLNTNDMRRPREPWAAPIRVGAT